MATLRIEAKYKKNGELGEALAEVPFETGKHKLPEVYPFTKNQYVGPDAVKAVRKQNSLSDGSDNGKG